MTSIKDFAKRVFGTSKIMTAVAVVLIVAGICMGMIAVAGWATKQQKEAAVGQLKQNPSSGSGSSSTGSQSNTNTSKAYTVAEVAQHGSATDCWMIIGNEVYNLTSFLEQHPGGAYAMTPYCGKDGTQGFATMGRGRGTTHSQSANELKEEYKIGTIAN